MSDVAPLLTPEEIKPLAARIGGLLKELDRILLGRPELHRMVVIGILSRPRSVGRRAGCGQDRSHQGTG